MIVLRFRGESNRGISGRRIIQRAVRVSEDAYWQGREKSNPLRISLSSSLNGSLKWTRTNHTTLKWRGIWQRKISNASTDFEMRKASHPFAKYVLSSLVGPSAELAMQSPISHPNFCPSRRHHIHKIASKQFHRAWLSPPPHVRPRCQSQKATLPDMTI